MREWRSTKRKIFSVQAAPVERKPVIWPGFWMDLIFLLAFLGLIGA